MVLSTVMSMTINLLKPVPFSFALDDRLVPFGNIPDFSSNPNVQFYKLIVPQLAPVGSHEGGKVFCAIGAILAFATPASAPGSLQKMSNLTDPSYCKYSVPPHTKTAKKQRRKPNPKAGGHPHVDP